MCTVVAMDAGCVRGAALRPGDRVSLVSPASYPDRQWLQTSVEVLESWGFHVDVGRHATDRWGPMAGPDEDRVADMDNAIRDPEIRAIVAVTGGMGSYRIADRLDFSALAADPKPIVGFSDITNIHVAAWKQCRLATIHGCLAGARATASVRSLLFNDEPLAISRNPSAVSAAIEVSGHARGPLLGGNLRELAGWVGAGLPSLDGAILLIEDLRHVGIGQVDRNITQLRRSGALDGVAGIALGLFDEFAGYTDRGWSIVDVLTERLTDLGIPILGGLDIGHGGTGNDGGPDQYGVTLGATADLDVRAATLTVGPCVR